MHRKYQCLLLAAPLIVAAHLTYADYATTDTNNLHTKHIVTTSSDQQGATLVAPSARPQVEEGFDLFITGDYLLWQPNTSGLAYVIRQKGASQETITKGGVKSPSFKYNSGFEIGLGCNLSHDQWDALLSWTCFTESTHSHHSYQKGHTTLFTTFISPNELNDAATAQRARAEWKVHFNMLDLSMGREFYAGKWLSLRPFFGIRSAWIQQHYEIDYDNVAALIDQSTILYPEYEAHLLNKYFGFGPRFGLNSDWGFGSGFSLYGNAGISLLYGFFHVGHNEKSYDDLEEGTVQKKAENSFHATKAATDLDCGLKWDYMFLNDAFHLGLHAGWQHVLFFSQNQFMRFTNDQEIGQFLQNQGDLSFQGWTFGARLDF